MIDHSNASIYKYLLYELRVKEPYQIHICSRNEAISGIWIMHYIIAHLVY